jgi:hypothetical protein
MQVAPEGGMNKREPNGVPWDIVDGAEDVIEVEGMEVAGSGERRKSKGRRMLGCRVDIAVGEGGDDCVQ